MFSGEVDPQVTFDDLYQAAKAAVDAGCDDPMLAYLHARTSIGANVAESQGGQTKPDFLAKMAIARKESWETIYWLKLAIACASR